MREAETRPERGAGTWPALASRALIEFTSVGPTLLIRHLVVRVIRLGKAGHPANAMLTVESSSS
jgi:hypothetical protein